MIEKDKILHSLPMKERMMMRISNFNKSSKEMENKAIEIYKSKYFFIDKERTWL